MKTTVPDPSPRNRKGSFVKPCLPLKGKSVYLDLKGMRGARRLEEDLKLLGGVVEKFLSKEINYLITSRGSPKDYASKEKGERIRDTSTSPELSTASPFNLGGARNGVDSPLSTADAAVTSLSRGKNLAQKASQKQPCANTDVLKAAQSWGSKVIHITVAEKWIQKEKKKLPTPVVQTKQKDKPKGKPVKIVKFKSPCIKIEHLNKNYRPLYQEFSNVTSVNLQSAKGTCPFDLCQGQDGGKQPENRAEGDMREEREGEDERRTPEMLPRQPQTRQSPRKRSGVREHGVALTTVNQSKQKQLRRKNIKEKQGYCECCQAKYEDLHQHLHGEAHRTFIRNKENFHKIDLLIEEGPNLRRFMADIKMCQKRLEQARENAKNLRKTERRKLIPVVNSTPKSRSCHQRRMGSPHTKSKLSSPKCPAASDSKSPSQMRNSPFKEQKRPLSSIFEKVSLTSKQTCADSEQKDLICADSEQKDETDIAESHTSVSMNIKKIMSPCKSKKNLSNDSPKWESNVKTKSLEKRKDSPKVKKIAKSLTPGGSDVGNLAFTQTPLRSSYLKALTKISEREFNIQPSSSKGDTPKSQIIKQDERTGSVSKSCRYSKHTTQKRKPKIKTGNSESNSEKSLRNNSNDENAKRNVDLLDLKKHLVVNLEDNISPNSFLENESNKYDSSHMNKKKASEYVQNDVTEIQSPSPLKNQRVLRSNTPVKIIDARKGHQEAVLREVCTSDKRRTSVNREDDRTEKMLDTDIISQSSCKENNSPSLNLSINTVSSHLEVGNNSLKRDDTSQKEAVNKMRKVKLRRNWSVVSDRSMKRLLSNQSESPPFEGFSRSSLEVSTLPTDISYVELSELDIQENSRVEWIFNESGVDVKSDRTDSVSPEFGDLIYAKHELDNDQSSEWGRNLENYIDSCYAKKLSESSKKISSKLTSPQPVKKDKRVTPQKVNKVKRGNASLGDVNRSSETNVKYTNNSGHIVSLNMSPRKNSKVSKRQSLTYEDNECVSYVQSDDIRTSSSCTRSNLKRKALSISNSVNKRAKKSTENIDEESCWNFDYMPNEGILKVDNEISLNLSSPQKYSPSSKMSRLMSSPRTRNKTAESGLSKSGVRRVLSGDLDSPRSCHPAEQNPNKSKLLKRRSKVTHSSIEGSQTGGRLLSNVSDEPQAAGKTPNTRRLLRCGSEVVTSPEGSQTSRRLLKHVADRSHSFSISHIPGHAGKVKSPKYSQSKSAERRVRTPKGGRQSDLTPSHSSVRKRTTQSAHVTQHSSIRSSKLADYSQNRKLSLPSSGKQTPSPCLKQERNPLRGRRLISSSNMSQISQDSKSEQSPGIELRRSGVLRQNVQNKNYFEGNNSSSDFEDMYEYDFSSSQKSYGKAYRKRSATASGNSLAVKSRNLKSFKEPSPDPYEYR